MYKDKLQNTSCGCKLVATAEDDKLVAKCAVLVKKRMEIENLLVQKLGPKEPYATFVSSSILHILVELCHTPAGSHGTGTACSLSLVGHSTVEGGVAAAVFVYDSPPSPAETSENATMAVNVNAKNASFAIVGCLFSSNAFDEE
ncbi:hypothetical protein L1987_74021 [Smallanthus sonchifolius]|uniref:Uncharacterized protein n=1 Tax=Smallanthus sonchifolius TaxID=185202 RepID=A0ACB9A2P5_9ASTR|nr:hypothetical protein L1987_74021 [Smallanthus sonchifolius]